MTPEAAKTVAEFLLNDIAMEAQTTKRVLQAVPDGKDEYQPDPKATPALKLAQHIASVDIWFLQGLVEGSYEAPENPELMARMKKPSDIPAVYEAEMNRWLAEARNLSGETLATPLPFFNMSFPRVMYLSFLIKHAAHHRGQLSTYLRPMGGKVPSIYGGSADEPFDAAAANA